MSLSVEGPEQGIMFMASRVAGVLLGNRKGPTVIVANPVQTKGRMACSSESFGSIA